MAKQRKNAAQFKIIPLTSRTESKIYDGQIRLARKEFGNGINLNLGWGVGHVSVASKIYGHGIIESWVEMKRTKGKRKYRIVHRIGDDE